MIATFDGPHRWLSNFAPCQLLDRSGLSYATLEHAYQACKAIDLLEREQIRTARTPGEAKRLARRVKLRPGWDAMRVDVMRRLLRLKFAAGSELARKLLATGEQELVEGNSWGDRFWGVSAGAGENWLGRLLMERRAELREGK